MTAQYSFWINLWELVAKQIRVKLCRRVEREGIFLEIHILNSPRCRGDSVGLHPRGRSAAHICTACVRLAAQWRIELGYWEALIGRLTLTTVSYWPAFCPCPDEKCTFLVLKVRSVRLVRAKKLIYNCSLANCRASFLVNCLIIEKIHLAINNKFEIFLFLATFFRVPPAWSNASHEFYRILNPENAS